MDEIKKLFGDDYIEFLKFTEKRRTEEEVQDWFLERLELSHTINIINLFYILKNNKL